MLILLVLGIFLVISKLLDLLIKDPRNKNVSSRILTSVFLLVFFILLLYGWIPKFIDGQYQEIIEDLFAMTLVYIIMKYGKLIESALKELFNKRI